MVKTKNAYEPVGGDDGNRIPIDQLWPTKLSELSGALVEQAPDAIIFADRRGLIRLWNNGAEAVFGYSPSEVASWLKQEILQPVT